LLQRALARAPTNLCPSCALVSTFHTFSREPALSLTSKVNLQGIRVPFQGITSVKHQRSSKSYTMATTAGLDLEVFGKGKPGAGSPSKERGDCPFSQRIFIALEEKKLPYTATFIEEGNNKPDWFLEKNPKGLMPVLRDGEEWIQDSDVITEHLEQKYPEISLKTPEEFKEVGKSIFPTFVAYLKSKEAGDKAKNDLVKELAALDEHLQKSGPYIAGSNPTEADFALIPKLHHMRVALAHYMDFQIPTEYSALHKYIELLESRPSFQKTNSPDEMIIQGWKKKFGLPDQVVETSKA